MKLYTRLGDDGTTSLYGGKRVMKDDIRIEISGEIDELNAHIGLLAAESDAEVSRFLAEIQARLFIVGSSISSSMGITTWRVGKDVQGEGCLGRDEIVRLESETDRLSSLVPPLDTFVLPGGSAAAAHAHVCRTVTLGQEEPVNRLFMQFVNRLSDYFFSLALYLNFIEGCDEKKLYITCK